MVIVSGVVPTALSCALGVAGMYVAGRVAKCSIRLVTVAVLPPVVGERSCHHAQSNLAAVDLFEKLESKAVWKIEELAELLDISAKTLYKQAARSRLPSFRIGSCVRVYGKGLADHLRKKMKK